MPSLIKGEYRRIPMTDWIQRGQQIVSEIAVKEGMSPSSFMANGDFMILALEKREPTPEEAAAAPPTVPTPSDAPEED